MDKNRDGTLTIEELRAGLEQKGIFELLRNAAHSAQKNNKLDDEFELLMESLDVDKDGRVDYNEFIQATINH